MKATIIVLLWLAFNFWVTWRMIKKAKSSGDIMSKIVGLVVHVFELGKF